MVGKVAVVQFVLSVAVDVAGGESVRHMSVLTLPLGWRLRLLLLLLSLSPLLLLLMNHSWRDARASCCSGPEGGDRGP